ncbi:MAG TPA: hypothetical protein VF272_03150 [Candidatus Saccharimonadia bacterium]
MKGNVALRIVGSSVVFAEDCLNEAEANYGTHFPDPADVAVLVEAMRAELEAQVPLRQVLAMHASDIDDIVHEGQPFKVELIESARAKVACHERRRFAQQARVKARLLTAVA